MHWEEKMEDSPSLYARASQAAARGDKLTAKSLLDEVIFNDPNNEPAWLLLSDLVEDLNEVSDCLQHALAINPQDKAAQQKYDALLQRVPELAELDPTKIAEAKKAEEAKKKAAADPNAGLDLENLDLTPLYGDKDG
jgi:DNA-binding SARP family transcriptional activator